MGKCLSACTGEENHTNLSISNKSSNTTGSIPSQRDLYVPTQQKLSCQKTPTEKTSEVNATDIRRSLNLRPEYDEGKIDAMFHKYKDDKDDAILEDGMEKLCQDLSVNPAEFVVLVLAWKFDASKMCRFTKKEFCEGCRLLKVDSVRGIRQKLDELEKDIRNNREQFRELYRFTFGFGLDVDEGQRVLQTAMAVPLWKLVFGDSSPEFMDKWYSFLETRCVRAIPRDTWNMFLHMAETIKEDFSNYDESEAWPSLFDDFVETQRKSVTGNGNVEIKE